MYLLKVLSADKTSEITSIITLNQQYTLHLPIFSPTPDLQGIPNTDNAGTPHEEV